MDHVVDHGGILRVGTMINNAALNVLMHDCWNVSWVYSEAWHCWVVGCMGNWKLPALVWEEPHPAGQWPRILVTVLLCSTLQEHVPVGSIVVVPRLCSWSHSTVISRNSFLIPKPAQGLHLVHQLRGKERWTSSPHTPQLPPTRGIVASPGFSLAHGGRPSGCRSASQTCPLLPPWTVALSVFAVLFLKCMEEEFLRKGCIG